MSAQKPVLLASDVHLGAVRSGRERVFLSWLEHAGGSAEWIILNGDLFDFWFEYRTGTTRGHEDVIDALRSVIEGGVPVTLMGGNHDWWGGRFLREEVGLEFLQDPVIRDIAGRRTLLAHGDGLGRVTSATTCFARFSAGAPPAGRSGSFRRPWGPYRARRLAHGAQVGRVGRAPAFEGPRPRTVGRGAAARGRGTRGRGAGSHAPTAHSRGDPGQWYVNSGDWVLHRSFVTLEVGQPPRLSEWDGTAG